LGVQGSSGSSSVKASYRRIIGIIEIIEINLGVAGAFKHRIGETPDMGEMNGAVNPPKWAFQRTHPFLPTMMLDPKRVLSADMDAMHELAEGELALSHRRVAESAGRKEGAPLGGAGIVILQGFSDG
jgi:hypothetical protein